MVLGLLVFGDFSFLLDSFNMTSFQGVHSYYVHVIFFMLFLAFFLVGSTIFSGSTIKFSLLHSDGRIVEGMAQMVVLLGLFLLAGPGFSLLNYQCYSEGSCLDVKVTGHQWYWSYDYMNVSGLNFDSFMKPVDDLMLGDWRLLDVDNRCVVPMGVGMSFNCVSDDVIHAFCLPGFGIKLDCMNGLLTSFNNIFLTLGLFYGQCSEICGANHSFMPIVVEVCLAGDWLSWVGTML